MKQIMIVPVFLMFLNSYVFANDFSLVSGSWCGNDNAGSFFLDIKPDGGAVAIRQFNNGQFVEEKNLHIANSGGLKLVLNESGQAIEFPISVNFDDGQKNIYFEPSMHPIILYIGRLYRCE